jgi:hypothetical protein
VPLKAEGGIHMKETYEKPILVKHEPLRDVTGFYTDEL